MDPDAEPEEKTTFEIESRRYYKLLDHMLELDLLKIKIAKIIEISEQTPNVLITNKLKELL